MERKRKPIEYEVSPSGCWICTSHSLCQGYPQIWRDGKRTLITRDVLKEKLGRDLLPGMYALHSCNEPTCINPDHLYEGTQLDNMKDLCNAGRTHGNGLIGEKHPRSKLSEKDIRDIRKSPLDYISLAEVYGVTKGHINKIRRGCGWNTVPLSKEACV